MPHLVALILLATGAFVLTRLLRRESARINRELDERRLPPADDRVELERDPETGIYRPRRA